jgi:hypothetical protein
MISPFEQNRRQSKISFEKNGIKKVFQECKNSILQ